MLSDDYEWKPDPYIESGFNKKVSKAWDADIDFARAVSTQRGYHYDLATAAKELFRPITDTTLQSEKGKINEAAREDIMNDPNIPADQKLALASRLDKIKLEKYTPETAVKKLPEDERRADITDALRLQNDTLFGITSFKPNYYIFGIARFIHGDAMHGVDLEPGNLGHQILIDVVQGKIVAAVPDENEQPVVEEFPYSKDLITLLTLNTSDASSQSKQHYMKIIDYCLGDDLKRFKYLAKDIQRSGNKENSDSKTRALDLMYRLKDNVKWINWISDKYNIPLRVQADRLTKSGQKYTPSTDTTFASAADDDPDYDGNGMPIFLSPHANERIKRAFVLLGHKKSAKEDNPDALNEFTSILDSLMVEKKLGVNHYKRLIKEFNK